VRASKGRLLFAEVMPRDHGQWACRVANDGGHIWRNFTLTVIGAFVCTLLMPVVACVRES